VAVKLHFFYKTVLSYISGDDPMLKFAMRILELLPMPTMLVGIGRAFEAHFCLLFVCLFVCLQHNSKVGIGNDLGIS